MTAQLGLFGLRAPDDVPSDEDLDEWALPPGYHLGRETTRGKFGRRDDWYAWTYNAAPFGWDRMESLCGMEGWRSPTVKWEWQARWMAREHARANGIPVDVDGNQQDPDPVLDRMTNVLRITTDGIEPGESDVESTGHHRDATWLIAELAMLEVPRESVVLLRVIFGSANDDNFDEVQARFKAGELQAAAADYRQLPIVVCVGEHESAIGDVEVADDPKAGYVQLYFYV